MPVRIMLVFVFALIPLTAQADDATPFLGPPTTSNAGGSNADSATLQPAGQALQPSTDSQAAGLTAPANALQAPITPDAHLQVLAGEADGAPHTMSSDSDANPALWWLSGLLLLLVLGGLLVWRFRAKRLS